MTALYSTETQLLFSSVNGSLLLIQAVALHVFNNVDMMMYTSICLLANNCVFIILQRLLTLPISIDRYSLRHGQIFR